MSENDEIFIVEPDEDLSVLLTRNFKEYGFENICVIDAPRDDVKHRTILLGSSENNGCAAYIQKPYTFATLVSKIRYISNASQQPDIIKMGPYVLNRIQNNLEGGALKDPVKLTEKERDILIYLHNEKPNEVSKQDLLDKVWGYNPDIETRTLETHIYRLRQKIENDPSHPKFLITKESGYTLDI